MTSKERSNALQTPAPGVAEAVEALRWYAEQVRLCRLIHSEGDSGRHALADDGGNRARAALATIEAQGRGTGGEKGFIDYATGADSLGTYAEGVRANGSRHVLDGPHPGRPEIAEAWVRGARFATFFAPYGIDATPVSEGRVALFEGYHAEPGDVPGDPWRVYLEIPARFGRGKRSLIGTVPLALIDVLLSMSGGAAA